MTSAPTMTHRYWADDEALVGRQELQRPQDGERQQQEHHRGEEGGVGDHLNA